MKKRVNLPAPHRCRSSGARHLSRTGLGAVLITLGAIAVQAQTVPGVGAAGDGAGISFADLDSNPRPDMILMAYDAPSGANQFRYRVGLNVDAAGQATRWSDTIAIPGVGHVGEGAGMAVTNLDNNPRPDLIFMAYNAPNGGNSFRYKVGRNVDQNGRAQAWSNTITVPGVGDLGQGAGLGVTNLDNDPRPDLIFMAVDAPSGPNQFRYKVAYNLRADGQPSRVGPTVVAQPVGDQADGGGATLANIDSDPRPDLLLMVYDDPTGANTYRYRVGYNLDANGVPLRWGSMVQHPGQGHDAEGAGVAARDLNGDGRVDLVVMSYDDTQGGNTFRYRVVPSLGAPSLVQTRTLAKGAIMTPLVDVSQPTGRAYRVYFESIYLHEQRDRREDIYLDLAVTDGTLETKTVVTPVYENLDEGVLYQFKEPIYFDADPHGSIAIWARMYDAKTGTYEKVLAGVKAGTIGATIIATFVSGPAAGSYVNQIGDDIQKAIEVVGPGDDDFYGTDNVFFTQNDLARVATCKDRFALRYFDPDEGFGDAGHNIQMRGVIEPVLANPAPWCSAQTVGPEPGGTHVVRSRTSPQKCDPSAGNCERVLLDN